MSMRVTYEDAAMFREIAAAVCLGFTVGCLYMCAMLGWLNARSA